MPCGWVVLANVRLYIVASCAAALAIWLVQTFVPPKTRSPLKGYLQVSTEYMRGRRTYVQCTSPS